MKKYNTHTLYIYIYIYITSMRPKQWIKNIIIFIPLIFSWWIFNLDLFSNSFLWFLIFSIFVWNIYILNDIKDIDFDKKHPKKKNRPIASWKLNKNISLFIAILLILTTLFLSYYYFSVIVFGFFLLYLLNTLLYIFYVKNIVILDIFSISFGFIIRWLIWIYLIKVEVSIWFLPILFFASLVWWFLKRYQELKMWENSRKITKFYSEDFLKQIISMLTTLIIMSYSFYTFNSIQSHYLTLTIPFVLFWIIRFMYNIFFLEKYSEWIEDIILKDKFIIFDIFLYFFTVIWIIYFL